MRQNNYGEPLNGTELDGWFEPQEIRSRRKNKKLAAIETLGAIVFFGAIAIALCKLGGLL